MSSSGLLRAARIACCTLSLFLPAGCGGDAEPEGGAKSGATRQATALREGALYLVVDFDRGQFGLQQGNVPLWTLPFVNADSAKVDAWVEAFQQDPPRDAIPLEENILLRHRQMLSDSVLAIVAEASGFDAELLQRQIPARFVLRWDDAALEVESPATAGGTSAKEIWQTARSTARRLMGEVQMTVQVDSIGALTLQRAAKPPILTIVRPPRKR